MNTDTHDKNEAYLELMLNQKRLINSSQSIIRKKRNTQARKIAKGDVQAIMQAATDRIHGSLNKEQREKICRILCEAKHKSSKVIKSDAARDVLTGVINAIIGAIDTASGLMISFLWIIIKQLKHVICLCKLTGDCFKGTCSEMA